MTTNAFRAAKLVAAALVSTVGLSQVTVASGCESRADPQELARELLDSAGKAISGEATFSGLDALRRDPQRRAQCMILANACEISGRKRASGRLADVSSAPHIRQSGPRNDPAEQARRMVLGRRALILSRDTR
jgi:hypothetical protein